MLHREKNTRKKSFFLLRKILSLYSLIFCFFLSLEAGAKNTKFFKKDPLHKTNNTGQSIKKSEPKSIDNSIVFPTQNNQVLDSSYLQMQADSFYLKGERAFSNEQWDEGIRFLKQALLYNPKSVHLRQKLAEHYTTAGLWAEATVQYEVLLKHNPLLHSIRRRLVEIYAFNDLTREALKHYKTLLKENPDNFSVLFQYALLLMKDRKWPQALKAIKTANETATEDDQKVKILLAEISIYGQLNRPRLQKKRLAQASSLQPDQEDLALKLAWLHTQFGKPHLAINVLQDYQRRENRSVPVTQALVDLFMVLNEKTKARHQLLKLKELGALDLNRFFYLAALLIEQGEYEQAIPFLKDLLIRPSPFKNRFHYLLGAVYEKQGKNSLAFKEYKNIPPKNGYFVPAQIKQAQILRKQGQDSKALALLKPIIFTSQDTPRALFLYTHLLWKKQEKKKTLNILTKGLKRFPKNRDLLFLRGLYFSRIGKFQKAVKDMEQILVHNPKDGETLYFLTSLYIKKNHNLDRAEALARKVLSFHPDSRSSLDTQGWALFQKGDFEPALKYLNQAYSLNNQSSYIASHLGEIYYQLKDLKKSRFYFKKAALLETNEKKRKEIQNRARILQAEI